MPLFGARQPLLARRVLPKSARSRPRCKGFLGPTAKMYVPSDSKSPERKAAEALTTFFTFVACKIILAQLEGSGRGSLASYNAQGYQDLMDFLQKNPIKDGDEWLAKLMTHNQLLGVRIMEVREAYCQEDFEWDECQRLAVKGVKDANVRLMREYAAERFGKLTTRPGTDMQAES